MSKIIKGLTIFAFLGLLGAAPALCGERPTPQDLAKADEHKQLAFRYEDKGDLQNALREYMTALEYNPYDADLLFDLGVACLRMQFHDDAAAAFERVVKLNKDDTEAYNLLGLAYRGAGRKADAEKAWKKSLDIDPNQVAPKKFLDELKTQP